MKTHQIFLWVARIWGGLSLAFLLYMVLGHLIAEGSLGQFNNSKEVLLFILFPMSTIVGLLLAYWKPRIGGIIVLIGTLSLYITLPSVQTTLYVYLLTLPGLLYVMGFILEAKTKKREDQ